MSTPSLPAPCRCARRPIQGPRWFDAAVRLAALMTLLLCCATDTVASLPRDEGATAVFGSAGDMRLVSAARPVPVEAREGSREFIPGIRVDDDLSPEHREPAPAWGPDGRLYITYAERSAHYNPEWIMFSRSEDGGLSWLPRAVRVNDTVPNAVFFPATAVLPDGMIVAVWGEMKFAPYNSEMRFARSGDGGDTWSPSVVIHPLNPATDYYRPAVLVVGERILVAFWEEVAYPNGRPVLVYSDDRGQTWSSLVAISALLCDYGGSAPCLDYSPENHLIGVVVPTSDDRICFLSSADLGASWSAPVQVSDAAAGSVDYPDLVCTGGRFHVVWMDNRNGQYDCDIWTRSSADGVHFDPTVRVNDHFGGNQYEPHIAVGPRGELHVCWIWNQPFQTNIDLYYSSSTDGGATWLSPCPRVNDVPYVVQPYVAWSADLLADRSGAYVFWNDGRMTDYYDNVYFSRTLDASGIAEDDAGGGTLPGGEGTIAEPRAAGAPFRLQVLGQPGPDPLLRVELGARQTPAPPGGGLAAESPLRLELLDSAGRVRGAWQPLPGACSGECALSQLAADWPLPAGVYFARVRGAQARACRSVLVLRAGLNPRGGR